MKRFFIILFLLGISFGAKADEYIPTTSDSLFFKHKNEKLSIKFNLADFKYELKKEVGDTSLTYRKFTYLLDSVAKLRLPLLTDSELNDFEIFGKEELLFNEILHELCEEKKVTYRIGKETIKSKDLEIKKQYYTCCSDEPVKSKLFKRKKGCSRKVEFHYKKETIGTLAIDYYPKIINCF